VILIGHEVGHWVAARNFQKYFEANSQAIGWEKDGKIVAGVIYEDWNGQSIVCHIAIMGNITPTFLAKIFDYPFRQLDAHKIIAPVASINSESIGLVINMGFKEEAKIKEAHPSGDIVIFTMTKQECRFLGEKYGKRLITSTTTST
jgi:RimJ/RimL family protein N-acetyltransferase